MTLEQAIRKADAIAARTKTERYVVWDIVRDDMDFCVCTEDDLYGFHGGAKIHYCTSDRRGEE